MNEKTIAAVALREEACNTFEATLREAARGIEFASLQGADLAVLPETINLLHRRDPRPSEDFALEDWKKETAMLCETAQQCRIAMVLPLLVRDGGVLSNRFYVLSKDGMPLGHYEKRVPAVGERASGIEGGNSHPILWDGLRIGGGICIDVYFPNIVFDPQMEQGADLFVIPSYTPAGAFLDTAAIHCGVPFVLAYSPWSRIVDRDGTELAAGGYRSETLRYSFASPAVQATINFCAVTLFADFNQEKMQDVQRHYGSKVRIRFNQPNCLFTLESRAEDLSVSEIMQQFGLVSRRDYFAQLDPSDLDASAKTTKGSRNSR